jgi:hypothetical protein
VSAPTQSYVLSVVFILIQLNANVFLVKMSFMLTCHMFWLRIRLSLNLTDDLFGDCFYIFFYIPPFFPILNSVAFLTNKLHIRMKLTCILPLEKRCFFLPLEAISRSSCTSGSQVHAMLEIRISLPLETSQHDRALNGILRQICSCFQTAQNMNQGHGNQQA